MFGIALSAFLVAACGGLALLAIRLTGRPLPGWLGLIHGLVAAIGLVALIVGVMKGGYAGSRPEIALVLLLLAALGGFTLAFIHHRLGRPLPIAFILIHAAFAVAGVVVLLLHVLAQPPEPRLAHTAPISIDASARI